MCHAGHVVKGESSKEMAGGLDRRVARGDAQAAISGEFDMRWKYADINDVREAAERAEVMRKIDAWWRQFHAAQADLESLFNGHKQWDLAAWMNQHLQGIDARLMWEYGPAVRGPGHRLVITPESDAHLRPLVKAVLARAPKIAGWEFYPYRLAEDVEQVRRMAEARKLGSLDGICVTVAAGQHRLVDLTYYAPHARTEDDEPAMEAAVVCTETILGEEVMDKWVGVIEAKPMPKGLMGMFSKHHPRGTVSLDRLRETTMALIGSTLEQLPAAPMCARRLDQQKWSAIKLSPEERAEYACREDMMIAITAAPELFAAAHCGRPFYSGRFSRAGETFCYLKIYKLGASAEGATEKRQGIEEKLNAALMPANAGCVIGGGTGLKYGYIDLALTDVPKAVELMRPILQEVKVSHRSWVLFLDADLADEWIAVWEDASPPPQHAKVQT